jgi:hypothetical protein
MSQIPTPAFAVPAYSGPMTISQILDRTFRLLRSNFWRLIGIAAVPCALILFIVLAMEAVVFAPMIAQWPNPAPEAMFESNMPVFVLLVAIVFILSAAIFGIYMAATCQASTQADYGIKVTFRQAYGMAWNRLGRHIWLLFWIYLRSFLPLLAIYVLLAGGMGLLALTKTTPTLMAFLLFPALLLLIPAFVYGILQMLRLSLAFPACVEEGLAAGASIERSSQLTQGARGRIFLVVLVIYAILYAAMMAVELIVMLLGAIGVFAAAGLHIQSFSPWGYIAIGFAGLVFAGLMVLWMSLTYSALTIALSVIYHDQRLRRDAPPPIPPPAGVPA